jgi:hypothetical protein
MVDGKRSRGRDVPPMSFPGSSVVVSGESIGDVCVSLEEIGKVFGSVTDIDPRVVELLGSAPETEPPCCSVSDLHQPPGNIVNSSFPPEFVGIETGFSLNDGGHKDRIDVVLTGNPCDRRMIGNRAA